MRSRLWRRVAVVAAVALALVVAAYAWLRPASIACEPRRGASVFVSTDRHTLALCEDGRAVARYRVRLGKHGVGKEREGDGKTPLGTYPLGAARSSSAYGLFAPIGYPTPEQAARGLTGSAVGIHGPSRSVRALGPLVNVGDTTDGCVGLATDGEMAEVADFVRARHASVVVLR